MTLSELLVYLGLFSIIMIGAINTTVAISGDMDRSRRISEKSLEYIIVMEKARETLSASTSEPIRSVGDLQNALLENAGGYGIDLHISKQGNRFFGNIRNVGDLSGISASTSNATTTVYLGNSS